MPNIRLFALAVFVGCGSCWLLVVCSLSVVVFVVVVVFVLFVALVTLISLSSLCSVSSFCSSSSSSSLASSGPASRRFGPCGGMALVHFRGPSVLSEVGIASPHGVVILSGPAQCDFLLDHLRCSQKEASGAPIMYVSIDSSLPTILGSQAFLEEILASSLTQAQCCWAGCSIKTGSISKKFRVCGV